MGKWLGFVTSGFAGPVCLALTIAGIVLSALVWRKKGARSGIRGIAWSLLPLAIYLVHALALVGRIVSAVVQFAASLVFSSETWLGVVLLGVAIALFLVSGGIPLAGRKRRSDRDQSSRGNSAGKAKAPVPAVRNRAEAPDDDLSDVRDILKRHGIS